MTFALQSHYFSFFLRIFRRRVCMAFHVSVCVSFVQCMGKERKHAQHTVSIITLFPYLNFSSTLPDDWNSIQCVWLYAWRMGKWGKVYWTEFSHWNDSLFVYVDLSMSPKWLLRACPGKWFMNWKWSQIVAFVCIICVSSTHTILICRSEASFAAKRHSHNDPLFGDRKQKK